MKIDSKKAVGMWTVVPVGVDLIEPFATPYPTFTTYDEAIAEVQAQNARRPGISHHIYPVWVPDPISPTVRNAVHPGSNERMIRMRRAQIAGMPEHKFRIRIRRSADMEKSDHPAVSNL